MPLSANETRDVRLRQKNAYNAVTAVLFLMSRWMSVFAAVVLWQAALANYDRFGVFSLFAATVAITAAYIVFFVLHRAREPTLQAASSRRSFRFTIRISGSTSGIGSFQSPRSRAVLLARRSAP